ncbi:MAG: right-handed parallel beta-helix repeat-containing protein [Candidatus Hydrogenedentes bacterium]|nr:right-handed parallel beta-helix repeat-containing protein [Candidatus Hydrogenedentota bacterium]
MVQQGKGAWFAWLCCLVLLGGSAAFAADPVIIHVAPDGNDAWSGSLERPTADGSDGPLASPAGALNRLRTLRASGIGRETPVRVVFREGRYPLVEPVTLTPEDSGGPVSPVIFEANDDAEVIWDGGVPVTGWREEADGTWTAPVPEGCGAPGVPVSALWINGQRRVPARMPNARNAPGDFPRDVELFFIDGTVTEKDNEGKEVPSHSAFRYHEGDLKNWAGLGDARLVVYHSWETSLFRVASLDEGQRIVTFTGRAPWYFGQWARNQWYFVENLDEALDQPGEWVHRTREGIIRYRPLPGERPENVEAVVPRARQLLVLRGVPEAEQFVEHARFRGITFAHTDYPIGPEGHSDSQAAHSVNAAVEWTGARHCVLEHCRVIHASNYGVWFRRGCQHNLMRQCEVYDLGAGGARIGECGNPSTEAEAAQWNEIDNCIFMDGGRIFRGAVGLWIGRASYNRLSHNEVGWFRYTGISVGWSWGYDPSSAHHNMIEFNHVHHIGQGQLNDMGGIYTLGISPGTIVRNNCFHDVRSNPKLYGGWGLYTDEGSSDILMENNIVYNTTTGGFHQHYGRENRIVNNILAFSANEQIIRTRQEDHVSFYFLRNIVYYDNGRLLGSNWKDDARFVVEGNIYWNTAGPVRFGEDDLDGWRVRGHDFRGAVVDPKFTDPPRGDFSLPADSPVIALGFRPIDRSQIGLYGDEDWTGRPETLARQSGLDALVP